MIIDTMLAVPAVLWVAIPAFILLHLRQGG